MHTHFGQFSVCRCFKVKLEGPWLAAVSLEWFLPLSNDIRTCMMGCTWSHRLQLPACASQEVQSSNRGKAIQKEQQETFASWMWDVLWAPSPQGEQNLQIQHIGVLDSLTYTITPTGILGLGSLQADEKSVFGMFVQLDDAAMECWQKEKPGALCDSTSISSDRGQANPLPACGEWIPALSYSVDEVLWVGKLGKIFELGATLHYRGKHQTPLKDIASLFKSL